MMLEVCVLVMVLFLTLLLKYTRQKKYNLPPGPTGLPFIGNALQLNAAAPHMTLTKWSEQYGDVYKIKMFGQTILVLSSFETIFEGLVTKAHEFGGRPPSERVKLLLDNTNDIAFGDFSPKWLYMKKTTMRVMKNYGENLKTLEVIASDCTKDMIEHLHVLSSKGPVNIHSAYANCLASIITCVCFGRKAQKEDQEKLSATIRQFGIFLQPLGMNVILEILPWLRYFPNKYRNQIVQHSKILKSIIEKEINRRKEVNRRNRQMDSEADGPVCFIDGVLNHQEKGNEQDPELTLTDRDIYGITVDLILGGTLTTSANLRSLIAVLVNKPHIQEKMAEEIRDQLGSRAPCLADRKVLPYIEAAILEGLRYQSTGSLGVPHRTTVDTTINGYDIPKDTEVFFNTWKLHHATKYWEDPMEFRPERFLDEDNKVVPVDHINRKRLIAFGASRRVCVGETLAKNRLFLIVTSLVQHFRFLPVGVQEVPQHDPRDYHLKSDVGQPDEYRVRVVPRILGISQF